MTMAVNKPYKALQILHNTQAGIHVTNHVLIDAVNQYLHYIRHATDHVCCEQ
jgi:hypothetical protein